MSKRRKIRIGGVPEHFNLPWHLAREEGLFEKAGVGVSWKDFPGGTGAMTRELNHDQLDIAVLLTEGMVADIIRSGHQRKHHGSKVEIVQFYVSTPLTWGVFVNADSPYQSLSDCDHKRFAISRIGSGSHLMASVFAQEHGFKLDQNDPFRVVSDLDGAVRTMQQDQKLFFLWEEFTTKHLVDSGEFRMVDKFETPWPCFVIAVRKELLNKRGEEVEKILSIINERCSRFMNDRDRTLAQVSERYGLGKEDTEIWFNRTEWQCNLDMDAAVLEKVMHYLHQLELIPHQVPVAELCSKFTRWPDLTPA